MTDWARHDGGKGWRLDDEGYLEVEGEGRLRTSGEPLSARTVWTDYQADIRRATEVAQELVRVTDDQGRVCQYPPHDHLVRLVGVHILLEASRLGDTFHRDPTSVREEPDYVSDDETPHQVSPGLMQTLLSTADEMADKYDLWDTPTPRERLFVPYRSIVAGTCYLCHLAKREDTTDPVLLSAAYNAGGIYTSEDNDFNLRVYGPRVRRTVKYWNDWRAAHG